MYDSIQIVALDTLSRLSISGKLISNSGPDLFKEYWFPLMSIIITSILGFLIGFAADIWRDNRDSRRRLMQKVQDAFLIVIEIERIFKMQISSSMMLPQYAASTDLARISDSIQNIESILNAFGWSLTNNISLLFRKYTALALAQKQTAFEYMHFSDSLQINIKTTMPNLEKKQDDLRSVFDNRQIEMQKIVPLIEAQLLKLSK